MAVDAAFWIKSVDDGRWTLYIASHKIDEKTFDLGYGEVLRLAQEMKNPYIDPFRVRLVPAADPLARLPSKFTGDTRATWRRPLAAKSSVAWPSRARTFTPLRSSGHRADSE